MQGERIQKLLASAGIASRRKAEDLIRSGRVTLNGQRAELGQRARAEDDLRVDGKPVRQVRSNVTYLLYKPAGVLSSVGDDRGRATVMDLVPAADGLHPVGRLDLESEGLLLLTNDGELTLRLTHPRYMKDKEYRVWCREGALAPEALKRLTEGVELEDGIARAVSAARAPGGARLVLKEGRKRQVRRMLAAVGYEVERLLRLRVADLRLGDLQAGQWRKLSGEEVDRLKRQVRAG